MELQLNPLTVGPIVGATSSDAVRIWGRGEYEQTSQGPRRCFGIGRIRQRGKRFSRPKLFKMNPNFDMTGIAIFAGLEPETAYEYEMGWFFSDLEPSEVTSKRKFDWTRSSKSQFTSAAIDPTRARSFVLGSCRYLLRLFKGTWFDDRGDKTFRSILTQITMREDRWTNC